VQIELNCSLVDAAGSMCEAGEVDIALVTRMNDFTGGQVVRQEQLNMDGGGAIDGAQGNPIPLALLPPGKSIATSH